jgi:dipeptidyl-peptidase-4
MIGMPGRALLFICSILCIGQSAFGSTIQAQTKRNITLEEVVDDSFSDNLDDEPTEWAPDGKGYLEFENAKSGRGEDLVETNVRTGEKRNLVPAANFRLAGSKQYLHPEHFNFSIDGRWLLLFTNSSRVWRQNTKGDYWALDLPTHHLFKLGGAVPASSLMFAKFSPDASRVGYVFNNNLFVQNLQSGKINRINRDGNAKIINGTFDWVYEEELDLRDGWRWSPDGKHIAYWQLDTREEPLFTLINDTEKLYPSLKSFPYPKAGEKNATARIGVVPSDGGPTTWMGEAATSQSGYLSRMAWSPNSRQLLIQRLNRLQNEDRYNLADIGTGIQRTVFTDHDLAWVDAWGPLDTAPTGVHWKSDGTGFFVLSEKDGWRHLYRVDARNGELELLTDGQFDVDQIVGYDKSGDTTYFLASPGNATQRYLYRTVRDQPGKVERVTPVDGSRYSGTNSYTLSPSGEVAIHTHSAFNLPPNRDVVSLPDHRILRTLEDGKSLQKELDGLDLGEASLLTVRADDGEEMDASLILPPHFDPTKKYPLFFEVYGEPAGLTVNDKWSTFSYLFNQLLAEKGYIVASVDNRGTPSLKGRAWRKSIYNKIGLVASADQAAVVHQLSQRPYVDATRVGVWGWSGGGSMTLNLMFRYPDVYSMGMAVAPVPDVRLYDTIYQERYMGLPKDNAVAYHDSSPISYAKSLRGNLLIVHGSGDDNVHYQGTEELVNELVANDKPFEMMVYPNRTHGISEGDGTTRHLYELLVRYLTTHLPAGAR